MMKASCNYKKLLLGIIMWIISYPGFSATESPLATAVLQPLPNDQPVFTVVVDDVDSDGRLDLLTTSRSAETAQVLYQKNLRKFEAGPAAKILGFHANELTRLSGTDHRYVLSAEGDAALKILALDEKGGLRELARRPQEGPFTTTAFSWPDWGISLAVAPYQGAELTLLRNVRPETAQIAGEYIVGDPKHTIPGAVTAVDIDADGIPELLYTTRRSRTLWQVNYPKDNQDPKAIAIWQAPVGAPRHLAIADINGDGAIDILLPLESERRIAVLLNDGKGNFKPGPELPVPSRSWGPMRLAIADDRDGALLLVADTEQSLMFYHIEKNRPYFRYEIAEFPLDATLNQLLLQDLDSDAELDVIVVRSEIKDSLQVLYGPLWKTIKQLPQPDQSKKQNEATKIPDSNMPLDQKIADINDPEKVLLRVGNHDIKLAELRQFVWQFGLGDEWRTKSGQNLVLHRLIEQTLIDQAIKKEMSISGSLSPENYATGLQRLRDRYFPVPSLPEEGVLRAYYDVNKEQFGIPEMVRLIQIQFRHDRDQAGGPSALQRAEYVLRQLESGQDFNKLAVAFTENPQASETGSDRGFVMRNTDVWLREALADLQPGQRTDIVSSPVGYEILMITDWRPPLVADFEVIRDKVASRWQATQQSGLRVSYLKALARQFGVTIMDKELENANPAQ